MAGQGCDAPKAQTWLCQSRNCVNDWHKVFLPNAPAETQKRFRPVFARIRQILPNVSIKCSHFRERADMLYAAANLFYSIETPKPAVRDTTSFASEEGAALRAEDDDYKPCHVQKDVKKPNQVSTSCAALFERINCYRSAGRLSPPLTA